MKILVSCRNGGTEGKQDSRSGGLFVCLFVCLLTCSKSAVRELSWIFPRGFQCPPVWKSLPSSLPEVRWGQPEASSSNFIWRRCSIESALISDLSPFFNTGFPDDPLSFPKHLSSCVFLTQCIFTDGPFWLTLSKRRLLEQRFLENFLSHEAQAGENVSVLGLEDHTWLSSSSSLWGLDQRTVHPWCSQVQPSLGLCSPLHYFGQNANENARKGSNQPLLPNWKLAGDSSCIFIC